MAKKRANVAAYSCFSKLKALFLYPSSFLESVKSEADYWPILVFYFVPFAIVSLIQTLLSIPNMHGNQVSTVIASPAVLLIFSYLATLIMGLIVPFLASALIHLGVLIFGGKNGFINTFKPITYSRVIGLIYGLLSSILLGIINLFSPMEIGGDIFSFISTPGMMVRMGIGFTIAIIAAIHQLVFSVMGISRFQGFSYLRSFFAIILVPSILFILAVMLIGTFIIALFSSSIMTGAV